MCNNIQNVIGHLAKLAAYPLKNHTTPADHYMKRVSYTYYVYVYLSV